MFRKPISRGAKIALGIASVLTLCGGYTLLSYRMHVVNPDDRTIPSWQQLYEDGLVKSLTAKHSGTEDPWIWADTKATFTRLITGIVVAVAISVVLGLLMGCYPPVESFFVPPLSFFSRVPPPAALAVFYVLFGTAFKMYVAVVAVGLVPVLAQAIFRAAKDDVPEELISKAHTLGASQIECIWDVIYKQMLPRILDFTRLQVGPAMVYIILAEMLVGDIGFGYRLKIQMRVLDMSIVYVYIIYLGAIGMLIDGAFRAVTSRLCPWYKQ